MNKQEFLEKLEDVEFLKKDSIIIASGALMLEGLVDEVNDIDMETDNLETYTNLDWCEFATLNGKIVKSKDVFEIGYGSEELNKIYHVDKETGWRYQTAESALEFKFDYIKFLKKKIDESDNESVKDILFDKIIKYINAFINYYRSLYNKAKETNNLEAKAEISSVIIDMGGKVDEIVKECGARIYGRI